MGPWYSTLPLTQPAEVKSSSFHAPRWSSLAFRCLLLQVSVALQKEVHGAVSVHTYVCHQACSRNDLHTVKCTLRPKDDQSYWGWCAETHNFCKLYVWLQTRQVWSWPI